MSVPRRHDLLGAWMVACAAVGCSGADTSAERQYKEMRQEIQAIQANNERLNERLTALELASDGPPTKTQQVNHEERPSLEVVRLTPGDAPEGLDETVEVPDDQAPPTVIRAEGDRVPTVHRRGPRDEGDQQAQAAQEYDEALDLIDRKRYAAALEALAGFLVRYPGHANADNAMYWRGECYYAMGNYVRAAEQFEGLISRFPKGNKVPDALLKLGLSQRRMGERDRATKSFEQLRKDHPNSDAASKIPRE